MIQHKTRPGKCQSPAHTSQQEPPHSNKRLTATNNDDTILGDVFIHFRLAVSSTKGHGVFIGANSQLVEVL